MAGFFCNKAGMKRNDLWLLNEKSLCSFWTPHWLYLNLPPLLHSLHSVRLLLSVLSFIFSTYYVGNIIVWNLATLRNFFWSLLIKSRVWDCTRFWLTNILKDKISQPRITTEISCRPLHPEPQKILSTKIEDCVTKYWPLVYFLSCTSVKKIQTLTIEDNVVFRSDLSSKFLF